jgi:5-methylcytosine-specific restriction endonuclease McrA
MIRRAEFTTAVRRATYCCERCGKGVVPVLEVHQRGHRADRSLFNAEVLCVPCHTAEHKKRTAAAGSARRAAERAQGLA